MTPEQQSLVEKISMELKKTLSPGAPYPWDSASLAALRIALEAAAGKLCASAAFMREQADALAEMDDTEMVSQSKEKSAIAVCLEAEAASIRALIPEDVK